VPAAPRLSAADQALRRLTDEQLAAELQRRGWVVMEP
jgi:DNA-binding GntR family transcriptional regulator